MEGIGEEAMGGLRAVSLRILHRPVGRANACDRLADNLAIGRGIIGGAAGIEPEISGKSGLRTWRRGRVESSKSLRREIAYLKSRDAGMMRLLGAAERSKPTDLLSSARDNMSA